MGEAYKRHKWMTLLVTIMAWTVTGAQQPNFIHLQTENNLPFHVQWKGGTYSSSTSGYLLIPQVQAGDNLLVIGFPGGGGGQEYAFNCVITDKPLGLSLRQGLDNNWSMFDMVSFTLTPGTIVSKEQLMEIMGIKPPPVIEKLRGVRKIFDKATPGGVDQVYVVFNGAKADTVALFIPALEMPAPSAAIPFSLPPAGSKRTETMPAILVGQPGRQNLSSK
jgi:hypothetical protein